MRHLLPSLLCVSAASLSACDAFVDHTRAEASITQKALGDARGYWEDVFTYHPPQPAQQPQTRYCYKMSSDIVCYDSVQPGLTSKLYGYQDGAQMSWIQPGGGSLGASGGNPVALQPPVVGAKTPESDIIEVKRPVMHTVVPETGKQGQIEVIPLGPPVGVR